MVPAHDQPVHVVAEPSRSREACVAHQEVAAPLSRRRALRRLRLEEGRGGDGELPLRRDAYEEATHVLLELPAFHCPREATADEERIQHALRGGRSACVSSPQILRCTPLLLEVELEPIVQASNDASSSFVLGSFPNKHMLKPTLATARLQLEPHTPHLRSPRCICPRLPSQLGSLGASPPQHRRAVDGIQETLNLRALGVAVVHRARGPAMENLEHLEQSQRCGSGQDVRLHTREQGAQGAAGAVAAWRLLVDQNVLGREQLGHTFVRLVGAIVRPWHRGLAQPVDRGAALVEGPELRVDAATSLCAPRSSRQSCINQELCHQRDICAARPELFCGSGDELSPRLRRPPAHGREVAARGELPHAGVGRLADQVVCRAGLALEATGTASRRMH
mmetsp:Transcript_88200/g.238874  ORF Transcript_88200/g.238874 Transcript_88200/m.238874 type:complete len:393 (+) Transcript_88200:683-1861(+)